MNEIVNGTALALPEPTSLAVMFKTERGLDPLLEQIEVEALAMVKDLDPAVKKDRELMRSAANKVSQSKAELDRQGKALTEVQRREVAAVNAARKIADDFLANLRDRVRKAADDWEAADQARKDRIRQRIDAFKPATVPSSSEGLRALVAEVEAVEVDATWQELEGEATLAKLNCLNRLREHLTHAMQREADAAELDRLRAEAAARAEADRVKAEQEAAAKAEADRVAREAAIQKNLADRLIQYFKDCADGHIAGQPQPFGILLHDLGDRCQRDIDATGPHRERVEAERAIAVASLKEAMEAATKKRDAEQEAARLEAVNQAKAESAERHSKELAEAEARRIRDLEDAKAREEAAAQAERDRITEQKRAADAAAAKRAADQAHRQRIRDDIATSMNGFTDELTAVLIANTLMDGGIPHCEVVL